MNFGFYASGGASRLKIMTVHYPEDLADTTVVVHDGEPVVELRQNLQRLSIPLIEHRPESDISDTVLRAFRKYRVDYGLCFGDRILRGEILKSYEFRIINFHPSILPDFPGLKAIDRALAAGTKELGNTAHWIDAGVDTGPVIMTSRISRAYVHSYEDILGLQIPMLRQCLQWLREGRIASDGQVSLSRRGAIFDPDLELGD
jgi:phosphoribosylglycinamide formyltransferase-1